MRSERLARVLLRLYPRHWRTRYGDEFLALVADMGLSWRTILDVVAAAGVERVRAVVAIVRHDLDASGALPPAASTPAREALREFCLYMVLVGLAVGALVSLGLPLPRWNWWLWIVILWTNQTSYPARPVWASWSESAVVSFLWFVAAGALAGLGWIIGAVLSQLGVPQVSDGAFLAIFVILFVAAVLRFAYCGIRIGIYGNTWPGMHPFELLGWKAAVFLPLVIGFILERTGEMFWLALMTLKMMYPILGTHSPFSRGAAARRRAEHDAIELRTFGPRPGGPQPPTLT